MIDAFRDLVKALHRAGIEVILDVVFNHTAAADAEGPSSCFRGLAAPKLIVEAWDAAGLHQVGSFVGDNRQEWNGQLRDGSDDNASWIDTSRAGPGDVLPWRGTPSRCSPARSWC